MEVSNSSAALSCVCSCLSCKFNTNSAAIACDETTSSTKAIGLIYGKTAARILWTLYMQAMCGPCKRKISPEMSATERLLIRKWYFLGRMIPTHAKQIFLMSLQFAISKQSGKACGSDVEPIKAEHEACSSDFREASGSYGRCLHNESRCPAERHCSGMPLAAVDEYPASELDVEAAQEWIKANLNSDFDSKSDIVDTTTEGKTKGVNCAETKDIVQMIFDQDNELLKQALERIKQKVDLYPAINSPIPSINDILEPKLLSEEAFLEWGGICIIDACDCWIESPVYGQRPKPRYQHGAFVLDYNMCVAGGFNGVDRHDDIQVLDLTTFRWSKIDVGTEKSADVGTEISTLSLPAVPCSGQPLITWDDKLFAIAGHTVDSKEYITVYELNKRCCTWRNVDTRGTIPIFRRGQSTTIVGNKIVIFGGEDASGTVLNDLHILDLKSMLWTDGDARNAPSPRSNHVAACHKDRFVFIFGGKGLDTFYNDLHRFDLNEMEWMILQAKGQIPVARAGHAGVTINDKWIIAGGRNCETRFSQTYVLDMSSFNWSFLTNGLSATEGMSLVASSYEEDDFIISFGGYDGNYPDEGSYSNEVRVLKLSRCQSDSCDNESDSCDSEAEDNESEALVDNESNTEDNEPEAFVDNESKAVVFKRKQELEASVIFLSKRKEELEDLVSKNEEDLSKRKEELGALVSKREEELEDSVYERKELEATLSIVETRKRKRRLLAEPGEAAVSKRKLRLLAEPGEAVVSE